MTREEALESIVESAKKYIDSLEARIAEFEAHKSCDGCKFLNDTDEYHNECESCKRNFHDYYTLKDSK